MKPAECPLSPQQWAVWTSQRLGPDSDAFNVPVGYRLSGKLDEGALDSALRFVLERHPVLRVTLHERADGTVRQEVGEPPDGRVLTRRDVTVDELDRWIAAAVAEPFAADVPRRLRAHLLRLGPEESVLVLVFDHIAVDAPSVTVITDELEGAYANMLEGTAPGPVEPETGYFDYARHQEEFLAGAEAERLGDFWDTYLAGLSGQVTAHGADGGRGPARSLPVRVPEHITAAAARAHVTPTALLMAAVSLTARHFLRTTDTVIAYPAVDWRRMEYGSVVGLFTDMLVFRCPPEDGGSLRDYVRTVHGALLECLDHQGAPLTKLRARLRAADPLGDGAAPVLLSVNNVFGTGLRLAGLTTEWLGLRPARNKADLALSVYLRDTGVTARLDFDSARHDEPAARRFVTAFEEVLDQIVTDPDRPAAAVELVAERDRALILGAWNPPVPKAPEWTVPAAFTAQAARTPDAPALVADGRVTTYRQLEAASRTLAARLAALGLPAGSAVALCLPRSTGFVTAALAVLRAGLAFLPVDMEQPPRRRAFLLTDAAAAAAVVPGQDGLPELPAELPVVAVDGPARTAGFRDATPDGQDPAYLITTSGSSGLPKTVTVPHRAIANHVRWKTAAFGFRSEDRFYFKTPPIFDASLWEYLVPLTLGARVVVAPASAHRDPALMLAEMRRYGVSVVQFVPTVLKAVLTEPDLSHCTGLRWVFAGGEPLERRVADRVRERTGAAVVNLYGPTEATIDATYHLCTPEDAGRDGFLPIGRPVGGGRAYVLGRGGQLLPPYFPGELHLGGLPLATGYTNRVSLTDERFVPHPLAEGPGAVLYRTGDLVRQRDDGVLEFLGREDAEVKVRGIRVDLAGIGAVLREVPGVHDAVVTVWPGRGDALAAYVVTGADTTDEALRSHLADRLPRELVPGALVRLDALPVTPSGKTDVRALPVPEWGRTPTAGGAPRSALESLLASLWAGVLGVPDDRVPRDVSLFELGGTSLTLIRLHQRIRAEISPVTAITDLFRHPTVAAFAAALDDGERGTRAPDGAGTDEETT
ncbi:non-ribosomal peptide synthetase [Streptomyces misionensis]|uniref:non-ribosomal peptide synthetase n=1 Tax=Streptomyces misionensis TaxID=67331 RepID=UPI0036CF1E92